MTLRFCYGVIGQPVLHSLSPYFHRAFAEDLGKSILYGKYSCSFSHFQSVIMDFQKNGGRGLSVTLPFKQAAFFAAQKKSVEALDAGAANALAFSDHQIWAHNTDGAGLIQDLSQKGVILEGASILILGAGGAAQGILPVLSQERPQCLVLYNRSASRLQHLIQTLPALSIVPYQDREHSKRTFDLIIHATSAGYVGLPEWPKLSPLERSCCYDLSYGQAALPFLNWAKAQGCVQCFDGLGLLQASARLIFEWWDRLGLLV